MAFDWEFLKEYSVWQLFIAIIALSIIVKFLKNVWPGFRKTIQFVDDIGKLSTFMDETEAKLEEVHHELHFNSGSTAKDAIRRVENGVAGVYPELELLHKKIDAHIEHSVQWKARLHQIDERTQPSRRKEHDE